jgi:hypothetical protein
LSPRQTSASFALRAASTSGNLNQLPGLFQRFQMFPPQTAGGEWVFYVIPPARTTVATARRRRIIRFPLYEKGLTA